MKTKNTTMHKPTEPLKFTRSQRGKPILWYLNYKYRKEREFLADQKEYWRCLSDKCTGRLIICSGFIAKTNPHTQACRNLMLDD